MIPAFIDTAIALRILYLLVTKIEDLPAFKLGLIGPNGEILRRAKTPEEKKATSMLLRLVLRIRAFLANIPLAQSKFGSFISAYALVREQMEQDNYLPTVDQLNESLEKVQSIDESVYASVYQDLLFEDAPVNATGAAVSTNELVIKKKFKVSNDTFGKLKSGKRNRKIGTYLNLENTSEMELFQSFKNLKSGSFIVVNENNNAKFVSYTKYDTLMDMSTQLEVIDLV